MEQLPDDVLLLLLQYLEVPDVLNCRLASKRLGGLALHRDVWRHRKISHRDPWMCTVLRLAPCLEMLNLSFPWKGCSAPYTTSCAVTKLYLVERKADDAHPALVIRNQEALGRLRRIEFDFGCSPPSSALLGTLASVSGLEKMEVECSGWSNKGLPRVLHNAVPTASLTTFDCWYCQCLQSLCLAILSAHSATLQEVMVRDFYSTTESLELEPLVALMAGMPNLQKLGCTVLPRLDTLVACPSLKDLSLIVRERPRADHLAAVKFLRCTTQLQRLTLDMSESPDDISSVTLLEALGSSAARRSLDYLSITIYDTWDCDAFFQSLVRTLPALLALRHLQLSVPERYWLLPGVTAATAPALRVLQLIEWGPGPCVRVYADSDAVKGFLSLNPMLHLKLYTCGEPCDSKCDYCQTCCRKFDFYGIFTHEQNGECSIEHAADTAWIHTSV